MSMSIDLFLQGLWDGIWRLRIRLASFGFGLWDKGFRINASKMMGGGWDLRSKFRL